MEDEILTLDEVADYLRCHRSTIYRLVKRGELPCFRVGSDWRFHREALANWTNDREQAMTASRRPRPETVE